MTMRRGLHSFWRDATGSAAAEMALILPLMLVLLLVTFEGGYFLWNEHKVVKGVRDGARYAGRLDFTKYNCGASTVDATSETSIKNITRTGYVTADNPNVAGADNPVIPGWTNAAITVSLNCATGVSGLYSATSGSAPRVTVSATVPYPLSPLTAVADALGFNTTGIDLNARAQSAVMGL